MEESFYQALDKTPRIKKSAFENNWPYILQATRNGLYVQEGKDVIVYYTHRYKNDLSCIVVVNVLGGVSGRKPLLSSLLRNVKKALE